MGRSKKIIDKIRINQFMVKNKNCSPGQRRKAYLELKRLNFLKEPGNVLMMPDVNMAYMYSDHGQIHHYLVYRTDKKNNSSVNLITHSRSGVRRPIKSLSNNRKTFLKLKTISKDRYKRPLKYYNFYESRLNEKIDTSEVKKLLKEVDDYNKKRQ